MSVLRHGSTSCDNSVKPGGSLRNIATPRFWLGPVNDYYSFNAFRGMFTFGAAAIVFAAWKRRKFTSEQVMAAAALAVVWIFAAVIAVSNVDLSSMGAALLPIGLVAVGWAFAPAVNHRRVRSSVVLSPPSTC